MNLIDPQAQGGAEKEEPSKKAKGGNGGESRQTFPSNGSSDSGRMENETTDMALFVRTSSETLSDWNRQRIVDALLRETTIDRDTAERISREVEEQIIASKISLVTAPLVRELVDAKLIEYGLEEARKMHTRLGVPLYDVDQLILHPNRENANVPHGPEATNLTLAERIKKEYALLNVFSQEIGDAHMRGDLHLHDLGFIDRPYCSGQSLEYIKKFGLNLPNSLSMAKPAKHPEVLLAHMVKFAAALQSNFAGAIGWDAVNLFFAPYLEGLSDRDVKQLAQMLIYEFSQQAVARGGQAIFTDINLYWEIPKHFENVVAIGPNGEFTGKTYGEYLDQAQRFVWALFDVYRDGDGVGRPFFFPKPLVHITEKFFQTPGHMDFLHHICDVSAERGNTYFVFDRGNTAKVSECCRLSFKLEKSDLEDALYPWRMRYCALQNVTLNLPRIAYQCGGDDTKLFAKINETFAKAVKAHLEKKDFLERLLALGDHGPLALLTMKKDGQPYLRMHRATFLIGMVGLNEMIQVHRGKQLHESDEVLKFGLKVIAYMKLLADKMSQKYNMRFVLEQTPAESTAYRFAKLDLRDFSPRSGHVVKGDISRGEVYYTNSTYLNVGSVLNPIDRVRKEGLFHPLIEAGSLTHIWLGESRPSGESLANFVIKVFRNSQNDQIAFSPEFTTCTACGKTSRGLSDHCSYCGSTEVEGITRITGYFTKVSSWNKGKLGELRDRYRSGGYFSAGGPADSQTDGEVSKWRGQASSANLVL
ncbi:MAG: anaerobic ribonucleoside-triphosphate reductase [Thermodesulfobacteriota bacterium]|jgi:ribonucleoside-triphosphate reductase